MYPFTGFLKCTALAVSLTLCSSAQAGETANWTVGARELPPPAGASE